MNIYQFSVDSTTLGFKYCNFLTPCDSGGGANKVSTSPPNKGLYLSTMRLGTWHKLA